MTLINKYKKATLKHQIKTNNNLKENLESQTHLTTAINTTMVALGLSLLQANKKTVAVATVLSATLGTANVLLKDKGVSNLEKETELLKNKLEALNK